MSRIIDIIKKSRNDFNDYITFFVDDKTSDEMNELTKNIEPEDLFKCAKLPFDKCFIQIGANSFSCLYENRLMELKIFSRRNDGAIIQLHVQAEVSEKGIELWDSTGDSSEEGKKAALLFYFRFLKVLYCMNCIDLTTAEKQDHSKINKKRSKKNKHLLTEHHVITLNLKHYESSGCKGDDTDRRPHLRRGHFRKLAEDRVIWVRNCAVGNVRKVNQEYKVKL